MKNKQAHKHDHHHEHHGHGHGHPHNEHKHHEHKHHNHKVDEEHHEIVEDFEQTSNNLLLSEEYQKVTPRLN
jgi:hypothetical protein